MYIIKYKYVKQLWFTNYSSKKHTFTISLTHITHQCHITHVISMGLFINHNYYTIITLSSTTTIINNISSDILRCINLIK